MDFLDQIFNQQTTQQITGAVQTSVIRSVNDILGTSPQNQNQLAPKQGAVADVNYMPDFDSSQFMSLGLLAGVIGVGAYIFLRKKS